MILNEQLQDPEFRKRMGKIYSRNGECDEQWMEENCTKSLQQRTSRNVTGINQSGYEVNWRMVRETRL